MMNRTIHSKFIGEIFISLLAFFLTANICNCQISAYDGFESSKLSNIWSMERMVPRSLEIQSKIVRLGKSAAKITLKTNDTFEAGNAKSAPTERDELLQTSYYAPHEGLKYEYQFSMFLPEDFPIIDRRLVIAQWKQYCQGGDTALCSDDSPVLAIRYVAGELYITLQTDSGVNKLYKLNDEIRNRWLDFKFQIRFSRQNDGEVRAFLNDKEIINYKGVTSYSEKHGYSTKSRYYFKMGLYRDIMAEPMTIYIDEFRMKEMIN
jgi:hypothetical protein